MNPGGVPLERSAFEKARERVFLFLCSADIGRGNFGTDPLRAEWYRGIGAEAKDDAVAGSIVPSRGNGCGTQPIRQSEVHGHADLERTACDFLWIFVGAVLGQRLQILDGRLPDDAA